MAFRFLLVTIVAGMGLQPPSRDEVSGYIQRGRIWVAARMDDWSVTTARRAQEAKDRAFRDIVEGMSRDFTKDLARVEAEKSKDRAFRDIVEGMSRDFSKDLARMEAAKAEPKTLLAFEPVSLADDLEQPFPHDRNEIEARLTADLRTVQDIRIEIADATTLDAAMQLNRDADGLSPKVEPAPAPEAVEPARTELAASPAPETPTPAPAAAPESNEPGRVERLSSAVNLTRQAFAAWASVLAGNGSSASIRIR